MQELAVGRRLCDAFRQVPAGVEPDLLRSRARAVPAGARRRRPASVLARPAGARRRQGDVRGAGRGRARLEPGGDQGRERQGRVLCAPRRARRSRARLAARARGARAGARCRGAGLPARAGLLQTGVELGLPRLPHSRSHGRSRSPAPARAPGQPPHAARGGHRALARSRWRRVARHGAGRGRRANDRRHRRRRPRAARAPEDAGVDAGRARDVLRDPPGRQA